MVLGLDWWWFPRPSWGMASLLPLRPLCSGPGSCGACVWGTVTELLVEVLRIFPPSLLFHVVHMAFPLFLGTDSWISLFFPLSVAAAQLLIPVGLWHWCDHLLGNMHSFGVCTEDLVCVIFYPKADSFSENFFYLQELSVAHCNVSPSSASAFNEMVHLVTVF